jgi:hypothetical protein
MNKYLFYFVIAILVSTHIILIAINVDDGQPFKFIPAFAAIMLIATLSYSALMGWGIKYFLLLTAGVCGLCLLFGMFNGMMNNQSFERLDDMFLYGSKAAAIVWPVTVCILGTSRIDEQEAKEKEEAEVKAKEQKL